MSDTDSHFHVRWRERIGEDRDPEIFYRAISMAVTQAVREDREDVAQYVRDDPSTGARWYRIAIADDERIYCPMAKTPSGQWVPLTVFTQEMYRRKRAAWKHLRRVRSGAKYYRGK